MKSILIILSILGTVSAFGQWDMQRAFRAKNHTLRITLGAQTTYHGLILLKRTDDNHASYHAAAFGDKRQSAPKMVGALLFTNRYAQFQEWFGKMVAKHPVTGRCEMKLAVRVAVEQKETHKQECCFDLATHEEATFLNNWFEAFETEVSAKIPKG